MPESLPARVLTFGRTLRNLQRFVRSEFHSPVSAPVGRRLWALSRGFLTESCVRYRLRPETVDEYVSDLERYLRTPRINGPFAEALNNKIVFSRIVASYGVTAPEYYAFIEDGAFRPINTELRIRSVDDLLDAVEGGHWFVVKPWSGGSGVRVMAVTQEHGRVAVD
ncbi:MAG: hypothetical protein GF405_11060, partial [Candidatus Eisenbacteria bacterium]|nr:hypothetical protein [Candidatus Eisenbacteria bacterium]